MSDNPDLIPVGDRSSHIYRRGRVKQLAGRYYYDMNDSPFMDAENTREIFAGTQFDGENHRRLTPHLQTLFAERRVETMRNLDVLTTQVPGVSAEFVWDVVVVGSGPHGVAMASYIREKRPNASILIVDQGPIGGQFRSYGPKPAFFMNSRVRKADRTKPNLPRTEGSINPLGDFAPLELSDLSTSLYPSNTDMGDLTALSAFVSASCAGGVTVDSVKSENLRPNQRRVVMGTLQDGSQVRFPARYVVDASGMRMTSSLAVKPKEGYFTAASFYRHFGTHQNPLKMFHDAEVMVIGGGDSALTVLEALVGQLPGSSYGIGSVGRYRPKRILWWGAPAGGDIRDIRDCLRSRYRNGIPQAIGGPDKPGLIVPVAGLVDTVESAPYFFEVAGEDGDRGVARYEYPNIVIDCTRRAVGRPNWAVDVRVGPESGATFSNTILRTIDRLGIRENNVSLWATMAYTNQMALAIVNGL